VTLSFSRWIVLHHEYSYEVSDPFGNRNKHMRQPTTKLVCSVLTIKSNPMLRLVLW